MLCQSHGKIMIARKILFGAHIKIPVRCMCQHGIDNLLRRNPYRAGRQSRNPISIIWRFYGQMNIQYAFQRKIPVGKFYRRVCLQRHTFTQSVHIKTRDLSHFITFVSLFLYDRSQSRYLHRSQSPPLCLLLPLSFPINAILPLHLL
jgi:hypothetical protein